MTDSHRPRIDLVETVEEFLDRTTKAAELGCRIEELIAGHSIPVVVSALQVILAKAVTTVPGSDEAGYHAGVDSLAADVKRIVSQILCEAETVAAQASGPDDKVH